MREAELPKPLARAPHCLAGDSTPACFRFPGRRLLTQAPPFPGPPSAGAPRRKHPALASRKGGGAGARRFTPKATRSASESTAGPLGRWRSRGVPHLRRGAWELGVPDRRRLESRPAGRGGGQLRHHPLGPPPPARPNSTPREGGADKGSGAVRSAPDLPGHRARHLARGADLDCGDPGPAAPDPARGGCGGGC